MCTEPPHIVRTKIAPGGGPAIISLFLFVSSKGLFSKFSLVFLLLVLESLVASCYYALVFLRAHSGLGETIGGDTPG